MNEGSLQYGIGFCIDSIKSFTPAGLKTDVMPVQTLQLIILDVFQPENPSLVIEICILMQNRDNKSLI